jgi:hypothetical protein
VVQWCIFLCTSARVSVHSLASRAPAGNANTLPTSPRRRATENRRRHVLARIADHKITDLAALLPWNCSRTVPVVRAA